MITFDEFIAQQPTSVNEDDSQYDFSITSPNSKVLDVTETSLKDLKYVYSKSGNKLLVKKGDEEETLVSFQEALYDDLLHRFVNGDKQVIYLVGSDNPSDFVQFNFNIKFEEIKK
jgi:hypothetical protein